MNNLPSHDLLNGKRGIIFGVLDSNSLAWEVAKQCHAEGANIVLSHSPLATKLGTVAELAKSINCPTFECDATIPAQIAKLIDFTTNTFNGKIDFVLHAIAMSNNIRRQRLYDNLNYNLNYNYFHQTLDVSALSLHKFLQQAKTLDAISEWGSIVSLSYIAAQRPIAGYVDMGDAKALLESITRTFGQVYGEYRHVRINTISQSPTLTRSTSHFSQLQTMQHFTNEMSPLGNATAQSCAKLCIMLFSDYTRFLTMQTIFNDGGFSASGLTNTYMATSKYNKLDSNQ